MSCPQYLRTVHTQDLARRPEANRIQRWRWRDRPAIDDRTVAEITTLAMEKFSSAIRSGVAPTGDESRRTVLEIVQFLDAIRNSPLAELGPPEDKPQ